MLLFSYRGVRKRRIFHLNQSVRVDCQSKSLETYTNYIQIQREDRHERRNRHNTDTRQGGP
jgi:hypothetical protein